MKFTRALSLAAAGALLLAGAGCGDDLEDPETGSGDSGGADKMAAANKDGQAGYTAKHGGKFELSTGKARALPAVKAVKLYRTEVEDGQVFVSPL